MAPSKMNIAFLNHFLQLSIPDINNTLTNVMIRFQKEEEELNYFRIRTRCAILSQQLLDQKFKLTRRVLLIHEEITMFMLLIFGNDTRFTAIDLGLDETFRYDDVFSVTNFHRLVEKIKSKIWGLRFNQYNHDLNPDSLKKLFHKLLAMIPIMYRKSTEIYLKENASSLSEAFFRFKNDDGYYSLPSATLTWRIPRDGRSPFHYYFGFASSVVTPHTKIDQIDFIDQETRVEFMMLLRDYRHQDNGGNAH